MRPGAHIMSGIVTRGHQNSPIVSAQTGPCLKYQTCYQRLDQQGSYWHDCFCFKYHTLHCILDGRRVTV